MSLTDQIKQVIIANIASKDVRLCIPYSGPERQIISGLLESGVLKESEIDSALEAAVIYRATKDCAFLVDAQKSRSEQIYPDHSITPEFLAYAIKNNKLSNYSGVSKIKFDHGENPTSFAENYCPPNLLAELREKLFNRSQEVSESDPGDYHATPREPCD